MGKALKAPDWPEIAATELQSVLARFPTTGDLRDVVWRSPRPFSAGATVETDRGTFFVKRHHSSLRAVQDLREEHRLIAHLGARDVSVAPVLSTVNGQTAISDSGWTYEVHGMGAGRDLYRERTSWTPFLTTGHAQAAGAALAHLHDALADYDAPARRSIMLIANDRLLRMDDPLAALRYDLGRRSHLAEFLNHRDWERDISEHLLVPYHAAACDALRGAAPLWGHGDWHGSNLMWSSDTPQAQVTTVLDFGVSDRTSALFDLATAIERSLIPWLDLEDGTAVGDLDQLDALLGGYGSVRPLSGVMLRALAAVLPVIHLDFALSEVEYFMALLNDSTQAEIAYGPYLLGHADWFGSAEGCRLTARLHDLARRAG